MTQCYHCKIGQGLRKELDTKNKYILERISVVTVHLLIFQTYQAIVKPNPAPSLLLFAIEKSVTTTTSKGLQNKSNYNNNARLYVTRGYPPFFLCTPHEPTPWLACTFAVYMCLQPLSKSGLRHATPVELDPPSTDDPLYLLCEVIVDWHLVCRSVYAFLY